MEEHANSQLNVVSRWRRFGIFFFDWVVIFIILYVIGLIIKSANPTMGSMHRPGVTLLLVIIVMILYYLFFESLFARTPGKFIMNAKVVLMNGERPDFGHIFGRTLARFIPFDNFSVLIRRVGWHDSVSGTLVVPNAYTPAEVKSFDWKTRNQVTVAGTILAILLIIILCLVVISFVHHARTAPYGRITGQPQYQNPYSGRPQSGYAR